MPIKRLENLLNPNADGDLGEIVQHAQDMGQLAQTLRDSLPEDEACGILAANVRDDGELVVLAATPAWAAKLRFEEKALMAAARATGAEISSCKIRVSRG